MPDVPEIPKEPNPGLRQQRAEELKKELASSFKPPGKVLGPGRSSTPAAPEEDDASNDDSETNSANEQQVDETKEAVGTGPVGSGEYTVRQGESCSSIARDRGFFWETLWNHPRNSELRAARDAPNVLLPGDRVHVPDLRLKEEDGATEQRHRFVRRGEPAYMTIYVHRFGEPLAHEPYTLQVDDSLDVIEDVTNGEGMVHVPIPGNAKVALLRVGPPETPIAVHRLLIGGVDPITEVTGIQSRLINLGYHCSRTGQLDPTTKAAISQFQRDHDLHVTGTIDAETRDRLLMEHRN